MLVIETLLHPFSRLSLRLTEDELELVKLARINGWIDEENIIKKNFSIHAAHISAHSTGEYIAKLLMSSNRLQEKYGKHARSFLPEHVPYNHRTQLCEANSIRSIHITERINVAETLVTCKPYERVRFLCGVLSVSKVMYKAINDILKEQGVRAFGI